MEDIKVYFHGRPQGHDIWGVRDGDVAGSYLGQVLNWTYGRDLPACMIIEHWNGDTFYSYIHRKDVFEKEGRKDAYCAITLRIPHSECYNVATLYELLKTAYEQLVDKAIQVDNKGAEKFLITKFSDIQEYLFEISQSVLKNFESHDKLKNSIFPLREEKNTNDQIVSYALQEVDSPAFREDAERNRILISEYLKPKMNFLKGQVDILKTEKESLQRKLTNISDEISAIYDKKLEEKENQISQLEEELQRERSKKGDTGIQNFDSNNIKDINQIIEIARQMASRFPHSNQENVEESNPSKHKDSSFAIPEVWYRWIVLVFLILLLVCSMALLVNIKGGGNNPKQDNPTEQSDTTKITDSSLTIHIDPSPVDNKLIVNTQYLLSLSDEDLECDWYYEDNQGDHLLDNGVLCPKTPNSHIRIKAVVNRDSVAISEFYTIDAAKASNKGTVAKGTDAVKVSNKGTAAKGTDAAKASNRGTAAKGTDAAKASNSGTAAKGTDAVKASNKGTATKGTDAAKASNRGTAAKGTDATKEVEVSPQQPK